MAAARSLAAMTARSSSMETSETSRRITCHSSCCSMTHSGGQPQERCRVGKISTTSAPLLNMRMIRAHGICRSVRRSATARPRIYFWPLPADTRISDTRHLEAIRFGRPELTERASGLRRRNSGTVNSFSATSRLSDPAINRPTALLSPATSSNSSAFTRRLRTWTYPRHMTNSD